MPEGVKDRPDVYAATAIDSVPATPADGGIRALGTPRDDKAGAAEANALEVGAFLGGRYRVVRFIARGGMGEVYEAFDEELRVAVALKVATKTTGRALDRFKREVMLARRVTHRNVCRLFEIGFETLGGETVPYCTMELLEGDTLSARIERGQLSLREARAIVEQIAEGLQAAHDVGVIHRDFKSNNILLVKDGDGRERAVISDFGLARAEAGIVGDGSALTADQALVGTPAYMAPEQVECKPATTATDVYALGVVMFEMVTNELPFRAETPMATAVLRLKQDPPSARARRSELGAGWDRAIRRCLEVDPARRFARAEDVLAAIDGAAPRRPILRWAIAGGLVAAAGIAAVVGLGMRSEHRDASVTLPAAVPGKLRGVVIADPVADEPWRGTEAGELLRAELRVPGHVMPADGDETARLTRELAGAKDRKAAIQHLGARTGAQLLITGELHGAILRVRLVDLATAQEIESYEQPASDLAAATAALGARLRSRLAGADLPLDDDHAAKALPAQPDAARAYAEGLAFARAHDHQHAIESLDHATALAKDFAPAYLALVNELRAVRQHAKAATAAQTAYSLAGSLRSDQRLRAEALYRESRKEFPAAEHLWSTLLQANPDDLGVASAYANALRGANDTDKCYDMLDKLRDRPAPTGDDPRIDVEEAYCARQAGDFRRALSAATRAELEATGHAKETEQAALALEGEMLGNAGEYDRALVVLTRARGLADSLGDAEGVIATLRQVGLVLGEQGKVDKATATYQDAIARARQIGDRLAEGILLNDWGQVIMQPAKALEIFQQSLAIAKEQGDERLVIAASLSLANKQDDLDKTADALATYADVIERAKAQHDDQNLATAEMNRADSLMKLDRYTEALPLIDAALASFQQRGDADGVGYALSSRGDAHFGLGDTPAARADYEASLAQRTKLGEAHMISSSQGRLARLDLAEERAADAEPLIRAAVVQRRTEGDPDGLAEDLLTLGRALIYVGKPQEALAAITESETLAKPNPSDASEHALIRGLADPAHAADQLAIIHATQHVQGCDACQILAQLDEADLERGLGHRGRAHTLLLQIQRRAKAMHAGNVIARTALLLAAAK